MEDYKKAALNLYPEDWFISEISGVEFKRDQNACLRVVAEAVFKRVFDTLKSEKTADGVAKAFLKRVDKYGDSDNRLNAANMSTALLVALFNIRDEK